VLCEVLITIGGCAKNRKGRGIVGGPTGEGRVKLGRGDFKKK